MNGYSALAHQARATVGPAPSTLSMQAALLPPAASILAVVTIFTCYGFAVALGHVQPWLPDITHCALKAPESYIFHAGMLPACVIMCLMWLIVYSWLKEEEHSLGVPTSKLDKTAAVLGNIASVLLLLGSAVLGGPTVPWTFHVVCATAFFILSFIAQMMVTSRVGKLNAMRMHGDGSTSYTLKLTCNIITGLLFVLEIVFGVLKLPSAEQNLLEWLLTVTVVCYNLTYICDFKHRLVLSSTYDPPTSSSMALVNDFAYPMAGSVNAPQHQHAVMQGAYQQPQQRGVFQAVPVATAVDVGAPYGMQQSSSSQAAAFQAQRQQQQLLQQQRGIYMQ